MRKIFASKNSILIITLIAVGILYYEYLPRHIQGGDTAELVTASRELVVAHPPGYPLWVLINSIWQNVFPPIHIQVFYSASKFAAFFALLTLALVAFFQRKNPLVALLCVLQLAFSSAFFESALLPDVFSFHAFFVAALSGLFLFVSKEDLRRTFFIPFLFMLALSHHHTIIFLAPLLVGVFFEIMNSKTSRKFYFAGLLSGFLLTVFIYLSMLNFHPDSYFSWGQLHSKKDVLLHFLRTDYGSFSFSPHQNSVPPAAAFFHFFKKTGLEFAMLILAGIALYNWSWPAIRKFSWSLSVLGALLFFFMVNFPVTGMGEEVILRFHVMPAVLFTFTSAFFLSHVSFKTGLSKILYASSVIVLIIVSYKNINRLSVLKHDSVIQDYATNLLKMAKANQSKLIIADNDNSYFALRYLQRENALLDYIVVSTPLFFNPWYGSRIKSLTPEFKFGNPTNVLVNRNMDVVTDLLLPNVEAISILTTSPVQPNKAYTITFLPLGRLVSKKPGKIEPLDIKPVDERIFEGPQGFSKKLLHSHYAHYYLALGLKAYQENDMVSAVKNWREALRIVPYCYPALENLCKVEGTAAECTQENKEKVQAEAVGIF